jgi:hypothetical protein
MTEPIRRMRANRDIEAHINALYHESPEQAEAFMRAHGYHFETETEAQIFARAKEAYDAGAIVTPVRVAPVQRPEPVDPDGDPEFNKSQFGKFLGGAK